MSPVESVRKHVTSALAQAGGAWEVAPDLEIIVGRKTLILGCPSSAPDYDGTVSVEVYDGPKCVHSRLCWYRDLSLVDDVDDVVKLLVEA